MASRLLLSRAAAIGLRALVELAREPGVTLSVAELARRQQLPQPMLEQVLLRLRRADLVRARRGRSGGYQLVPNAEALPLDRVLQAVERPARLRSAGFEAGALLPGENAGLEGPAAARQEAVLPPAGRAVEVPGAADRSLADGGGEGRGDDWDRGGVELAGADPEAESTPDSLGASAGHRVEQQLRQRLELLLQRELQRLTLAELLYDQRSWEASLGPEGGVMLS